MSLRSLTSTHAADVKRMPLRVDASGGATYPKDQWVTVDGLAGVKGSLQPLTTYERMVFAQRQLEASYKFFVDGAKARLFRKDYQVAVTHPVADAGRLFRVVGIDDVAGKNRLTRILLKEL